VTLFVGASTAYYAATYFVGMVSAASAAFGVIVGRARLLTLCGLAIAIPFAVILTFLFQSAEV
jgi:hypothetical protein